MKPTQGRRTWVKLWVGDWLDGTTRYQMSDAQRAFWIDLIAMAGRGRIGGIVCSGKDGDTLIGYPLKVFEALMSEPIDVLKTFALFERTGKITVEVSGDSPKLYIIHILSWEHYQSEYERNKKYREPSSKPSTKKVHPKSQPKSHAVSQKSSVTEVEVDSESDSESEKPNPKPKPKPRSAEALLSAEKDFGNRKTEDGDPRFRPVLDAYFQGFEKRFAAKPDFNTSDAKVLNELLKRRQETAETLKTWLANAFASDDVWPLRAGFRLKEFCNHAVKFANGPIKNGTSSRSRARNLDGHVDPGKFDSLIV